MTTQEAVKAAYKNHPVMVSMKKELGGELVKAAIKGGADDVDAKELRAAMAKAWAQDGLTLSERTTKGNAWVVHTVSETIEAAVKKGGSVMAMAKEIFDGYGKAGYIAEQDLPQFLDELVGLGRACKEDGHFKIALREAERSASKLTTKGLQAAYNGILKAIEAGNQDRVAKAIYVAVQEKTRYFAERIARTEKARAYADGMMYKYAADPDCVAFKWKLSGRHPCDDVCDLYAKADLWGMGEGIFPKDKVPTLPVHPNCMCRLIPVYAGSKRLKSETPVNRNREGGTEYIKRIPMIARKSLLGVNGAESVGKGADWRHYARGYSGKAMAGRITGGQEYRTPVIGNASSVGQYRGTLLTACPVVDSQYDLSIVTSIPAKPRLVHTVERGLREAGEAMRIAVEEFPKVIITDEELGGAVGVYQSVEDRVLLNAKLFDRDWVRKTLGSKNGQIETIVHELYHWKDAQEYRAAGGTIANSNEYIAELCAMYKRKFDKLVASGYDVNGVSGYATAAHIAARYDEFFTEYRVKKLLKGRKS